MFSIGWGCVRDDLTPSRPSGVRGWKSVREGGFNFTAEFLLSGFGSLTVAPLQAGQMDQSRTSLLRNGQVIQTPPTPDAIKALGVMLQVVSTIEEFVKTKELSSVHNEDMMLYSALTILLKESGLAPDGKKNELEVALVEFGRLVADLHTAADAFNQVGAEAKLKTVLAAFEHIKTIYRGEALAAARSLSERYACPMHPNVVGKKGGLCPKCGMELDQPIRISLFGSGVIPPHTIIAAVRTKDPLVVGVQAQGFLRLTKLSGGPALLTDLREVHTEKIHLLIIDSSLTDYHHEHPRPTDIPGEYSFNFTPRKPGPYRVWADLRPTSTGFQEYAMANLVSSTRGDPLTDKSVKLVAKLDGLRYELFFDKAKLKADQPVLGRLRITKLDGTPFTQLEPIMGAFAHLVGFSEDYKTVVHLHPKGSKLLTAQDRGGPELEFQFYAAQPGFVRFFAQVQIKGVSRFAPFGLCVDCSIKRNHFN